MAELSLAAIAYLVVGRCKMTMNSIGEMLHTLKRRSDVLGLIQCGSAECTDENLSGLEMVKSLGADQVIDYTKDNFTKSGQTHDIIFDTVGKISGSRSKGSLKKKKESLFLLKVQQAKRLEIQFSLKSLLRRER